jgi:carbamoyl-phosphate synthase small subunit
MRSLSAQPCARLQGATSGALQCPLRASTSRPVASAAWRQGAAAGGAVCSPRASCPSTRSSSSFVSSSSARSTRSKKQLVVRAAAAYPFKKKDAKLVLEDGSVFEGVGFGCRGTEVGEVVFNTSMCGYQEIMTDPSYKGQFVAFTYPHIGNTGVNTGALLLWGV